MRYQHSLAAIAASGLSVASAATSCPTDGPLKFWVKAVGIDNGGLLMDYLPYSPSYSMLNLHTRDAQPSWIRFLNLDSDGTLSLDYDDPNGNSQPNSGFFITLDPISDAASPPPLQKGDKDLSKDFKPLLSVYKAQEGQKFKIVESYGEQLLVPDRDDFKGWVACQIDFKYHDKYPVLAWTDKEEPDYEGVCHKVQLWVGYCEAAKAAGTQEL